MHVQKNNNMVCLKNWEWSGDEVILHIHVNMVPRHVCAPYTYSCCVVPYSWLFACARAQKIVPVDPHLITNTTTERNGMETALAVTAAAKVHSSSDMGMEIGNGTVEQEEPSDNHPLSSVVLCFSKKVASQESKSL